MDHGARLTTDVHVIPINDLEPHEETRACWCEPRLKAVGRGVVVVHFAKDGRELVEQHGLN